MSKKTRKIINIVLIAILVVGLSIFGRSVVEKYRAENIYNDVKSIIFGNDSTLENSAEDTESSDGKSEIYEVIDFEFTDPYVEELLAVDISALIEIESEVKGWIYIPDTIIDYPIMQHEDNEYYLLHTWEGTPNKVGSIFFDCQNAADLTDFNTIIYGHNMKNGSMFGVLDSYFSDAFLKEHPSIYIVTENGIYKYNIFAGHRAGTETISFGMKIQTEPMRKEFISFALDYSQLETGITPTTEDSILTLATCSYGSKERIVIQAVLDEDASYIRD